jgi:hypothetical protein
MGNVFLCRKGDFMKAHRKRIMFVLVLLAVTMALPGPCFSATAEEIRAERRRIDEQVTRIDREIASMKKELALFETAKSRIYSALIDPKVYVIGFWMPELAHPDRSYYCVSEKQAMDLAEWNSYSHLLLGESVSPDQAFENMRKNSAKYKEKVLRADMQKFQEMILKTRANIAQQEKEKERLVDRFNVLLATKQESKSQVSGIPAEPPATWRECEDSNVRICGTWTYNDVSQTFIAVWDNGAKATLKLTKFDSQGVRVTRNDQSGASKGLQAEYTGRITPSGITDGKVTWVWGGRAWHGTWSATW